jgi:uncharacterized protein (DUF697 family)/GTP-binding protein EngB required for normal cell division
MDTAEDFLKLLTETLADELKALGRFNLAIYGKSGVGKSTLINAVFGEEVAATGIGRPVTRESKLHVHHSHAFGLYDTKGLEVGKDNAAILAELRKQVADSRNKESKDQIHAVWYCVQAQGARFEDSEADFIREVAKLELPVLLVVTKVARREGQLPHPEAIELAEEIRKLGLPLAGDRVHLVMSKGDDYSDLPSHGLQELLDATFQVVPDAARRAFVAAQKLDFKAKDKATNEAIAVAIAAAGAAAITPIPFASAGLLVPIQVGLMARIAQIYGVPFDRTIAASMALTTASTSAGRTLVANLMKFVPGIGSVGGGAINAGVAVTVTTALGAAWQTICISDAKGDVDLSILTSAEVVNLFKSRFKST